jgi:segregation and condensation protein A
MRRFHIGSAEWAPPRVPIQLPLGEGSLGWLVSLIRKHRLDLLDLQLAPIAEACWEYWQEYGDLDEGGDAVAALAYLTERKAERLLAPPPEPEPEEPEPLWTSLPQQYRLAMSHLTELESERADLFFRRAAPDLEDYELPLPFGQLDAKRLLLALHSLLERALPLTEPSLPERPHVSIHARMIEIRHWMNQSNEPASFEQLLPANSSRIEILSYFLALLELLRLQQIEVELREDGIWMRVEGEDRRTGGWN